VTVPLRESRVLIAISRALESSFQRLAEESASVSNREATRARSRSRLEAIYVSDVTSLVAAVVDNARAF